MQPAVLDLFSGIGGFALGLERAGLRIAMFCESDPYCRQVLAKHWPRVPCHHDVCDLVSVPFEPEVIVGGFPCQPFSTASRGRPVATDLWPEMLRCLRMFRPRWAIGENVPGIGLDGVDRVCADLESADYAVWPLDVDTSPPGRSRGRRRFFWLAHANRQGEPRRTIDAQVASVCSLPGRGADDPCPLGMDDGLSGRMDRLRALGNAVTPWVAEMLGRAILRSYATDPG